MKTIQCTLSKTLIELNITKNKLAVESKIRPNTISDIANNNAKAINFETLDNILHTLEQIAFAKGIDRQFNVDDVFIYSD